MARPDLMMKHPFTVSQKRNLLKKSFFQGIETNKIITISWKNQLLEFVWKNEYFSQPYFFYRLKKLIFEPVWKNKKLAPPKISYTLPEKKKRFLILALKSQSYLIQMCYFDADKPSF